MSTQNGWDALNLKPTGRIPRSELSAQKHWELVERVCGLPVTTAQEREIASAAFIKAWDWDYFWYVYPCINDLPAGSRLSNLPDHGGPEFLTRLNPHAPRSRMGHAEYEKRADGKSDFSSEVKLAFRDEDEALALDPVKAYGTFDLDALTREFEAAHQELTTWCPDTLHMGGVYISLFSGLIEIFGWEMLLVLMLEEDFGKVVEGYAEWSSQLFEAYARSNIPVIIVHDDLCWTSGPVTHPAWYRKHIFPRYREIFGRLKAAGKKILFTCDGDMSVFFDDIVDCGADMIITEPMSDFESFAKKHGQTTAFFGVMDTRVLMSNDKKRIFAEVERLMNLYRECPGFFMGVGNHIPQNTTLDAALWYQEAYETFAAR